MTRRSGAAALLLLLAAALAVGPRARAQEGTAAAAVSNAREVLGRPNRAPLAGDALAAEAQRVALLLRCPVCQGLSVAESPSSMAINMREQVRELVAQGYDEEQVLRYFERSYGEFVRLEPPLRGVNWLVWLAPGLGLLAGAAAVYWTLRRPRAGAAAAPAGVAPAEDAGEAPRELADEPELLPYLRRVREDAYGWPGGEAPAPASARPETPA